MNKIFAVVAMLVALSACHAGAGIGDNNQPPIYRTNDALASAIAQSSVGTAVTTGN
jgi:hypothetical protein